MAARDVAREPGMLGVLLRAALLVSGVSSALVGVAAVFVAPDLRFVVDMDRAIVVDAPSWARGEGVSVLAQLPNLALLATIVAWLLWQHRATANLWAWRLPDLTITPGWSVGWWFVPFASLVMPPVAVAELDRRSGAGSARSGAVLVGAWWLAWLATWIVPAVGAIGWALPRTIEVFEAVDANASVVDLGPVIGAFAPWALAHGLLALSASFLAIAIVGRIERAQTRRWHDAHEHVVPPPSRPDLGA